MLSTAGQILFCGSVIRANRYYCLGISGGHAGSYDDGFYEFDLYTNTWICRMAPTPYGSTKANCSMYGEWSPGEIGRPAAQHSYNHQVALPNGDIVQAWGYAVGNMVDRGAGTNYGASKQAHRWSAATGRWERYGTYSGASTNMEANCFFDTRRNRIVRMPAAANWGFVEWIPADNPSAGWSQVALPNSKQSPASTYSAVGYHPVLDCYVLISPRDFAPTTRVFVMDAANVGGGWTEAPASGTAIARCTYPGLEFIPPMNGFCTVDQQRPDTLHYLRPSGKMTDPWVWSGEVFSGSSAPASWDNGDYSGAHSRARWSEALNGIVIVKSSQAAPELFRPMAVGR